MAKTTDPALQSQVLYSVFVRNQTEEGTFNALIGDLDRIRALGTDVIWLMPIHPIGEENRKGTLGSPYAIRDYRAVNPEYGTLEDFEKLIEEIHTRGMKCIIDVVYNHTSPDSVLWNTHPEYFYRRPDGSRGNRVGDWSDIIDLEYAVPELWDYQIETLVYWAKLVDGFRCDVASFVPTAFWKQARETIAKFKPDFLWVAETSGYDFLAQYMEKGIKISRDIDLFDAFDVEYEYDIRDAFGQYLNGKTTLGHYLDMMNFQDAVYPPEYNKLRFLENHDLDRIASQIEDENDLLNFVAFVYFQKGMTMLYGGQEYRQAHRTSLFDKETIVRDRERDISPFLTHMGKLKKALLSPDDHFFARWDNRKHFAILRRFNAQSTKIGIFSLRSRIGNVELDNVSDGAYVNHIDGTTVTVRKGKVHCEGKPILLVVERQQNHTGNRN